MQQTQFITCHRCNGRGRSGAGRVCGECGGIGLGTFIKNDFFYWGYDILPAKIIIRQSQRVFDAVVLAALVLLGAYGLFSFFWWMAEWAVADTGQLYLGRILSFWGERDSRLLFFWLGLICLVFACFRWRRVLGRSQKVKLWRYSQLQKIKQQVQRVPNNWRELRFFRAKHDVSKSYDKDLIAIIERAYVLADSFRHRELLPLHIVVTLLNSEKKSQKSKQLQTVKEFFGRLDIHHGKVMPKLKAALEDLEQVSFSGGSRTKQVTLLSQEVKKCLTEGYFEAQEHKHERVQILDIITPLLANGPFLLKLCDDLGITPPQVERTVSWLVLQTRPARKIYRRQRERWRHQLRRATNAVATPVLNHFCADMTEAARAGKNGLTVERAGVLREIFSAFDSGKKHIILTGAPGAGRFKIIETIAERIINDDVPAALRRKRLLTLDTGRLAAEGADMALDKKFMVVVSEAVLAGDIALVVRDASGALLNLLQNQAESLLTLVLSDNHGAEDQRGVLVTVGPPAPDELFLTAAVRAVALEKEYKVYFNYEAIAVIERAASAGRLGDKFLDGVGACLKKCAQAAAASAGRRVDGRLAAKTMAADAGIPYTKILKNSLPL